MNAQRDYWRECMATAAEECVLPLTPEQLDCLACAAESGHENYTTAFYSPPSSDRVGDIEREAAGKMKRLQDDFDTYRNNAETAVKQALRQYPNANVTIGAYGEVLRHDGRTERIQ